MCSVIAFVLVVLYILEYVPTLHRPPHIPPESSRLTLSFHISRYVLGPRVTMLRFNDCSETASHVCQSVSPAMLRYLLERRNEGHFVALGQTDNDMQHCLAFVGAGIKGSRISSCRFSTASLSLS